jgi:hypothetical protein
MEREQVVSEPAGIEIPAENAALGTGGMAPNGRTRPGWRAFALAILAAVVLSVMATLLLGGSFSSDTKRQAASGSSGGYGTGGSCCPLPQEAGK